MSREIKFRVWDTMQHRWFHGGTDDRRRRLETDAMSFLGKVVTMGDLLRDQNTDEYISISRLNDLVVLQFTGLQDKNGRDIYEGDVVARRSERVSLGGTAWYRKVSKYDGPTTVRGTVTFTSPAFDVSWENGFNDALMRPRGKEVDPRGFHEWSLAQGESKFFEVIGNVYVNPELLTAKAVA